MFDVKKGMSKFSHRSTPWLLIDDEPCGGIRGRLRCTGCCRWLSRAGRRRGLGALRAEVDPDRPLSDPDRSLSLVSE